METNTRRVAGVAFRQKVQRRNMGMDRRQRLLGPPCHVRGVQVRNGDQPKIVWASVWHVRRSKRKRIEVVGGSSKFIGRIYFIRSSWTQSSNGEKRGHCLFQNGAREISRRCEKQIFGFGVPVFTKHPRHYVETTKIRGLERTCFVPHVEFVVQICQHERE
jgi:hypothetical protein